MYVHFNLACVYVCVLLLVDVFLNNKKRTAKHFIRSDELYTCDHANPSPNDTVFIVGLAVCFPGGRWEGGTYTVTMRYQKQHVGSMVQQTSREARELLVQKGAGCAVVHNLVHFAPEHEIIMPCNTFKAHTLRSVRL